MANIFKTLSAEDLASTRTLLYEQIPLTGAIFSASYSSSAGETNILNYSHGMFQTVYDYPYLSSSANTLFDISFGSSKDSVIFNQAGTNQRNKKLNIYNQMAKTLYGYDVTGSVVLFDRDGNNDTSTDISPNGYFLTFSRLLIKDEIKKGTFNLKLGLGASDPNKWTITGTLTDVSGALSPPSYLTNAPVGDYGILFLSESLKDTTTFPAGQTNKSVGLIFYQAGVVFISSDVFAAFGSISPFLSMSLNTNGQLTTACSLTSSGTGFVNIQTLALNGTVDQAANAFRRRISNIQFQNTTELNSSIYFLRINNNEFNYSSNPTYLTGSEIRVKGGNPANSPISYITTAGLYSPDNELMAVAKLSQPLKKTEEQSMILRVRLDY